MPEGTHTLYYRAQGNNGLMEIPRSATYMVDLHRPMITVTLSGRQGDNGWYNSSVQLMVTAGDNESGVAGISYDLDGSSQAYSGPLTIGDGTHSLTLRAADNAGNVNTSTRDGIKVDATPPEIICVLAGTGSGQGWYVSDVLATLRSSDNLAGVSRNEYSTDGTNWKSYESPFTIKTGGQVTVYYRARDNAGNTAGDSQIVNFPPASGNAPGNDPLSYSSTPAPTTAPALSSSTSPSPSPAASLKPTATPTPVSTPSGTPPANRAQESTNMNWLLLLIAILVPVAAILTYLVFGGKKNKGNKRL
jgi:cell division septation protein DedD